MGLGHRKGSRPLFPPSPFLSAFSSAALGGYLDFPHLAQAFAINVIKSKGVSSVAQKMREPNKNIRLVFDYLRMTKNSRRPSRWLK